MNAETLFGIMILSAIVGRYGDKVIQKIQKWKEDRFYKNCVELEVS